MTQPSPPASTATLTGTLDHPRFEVAVNTFAHLPGTHTSYLDWYKTLPATDRTYAPTTGTWTLYAIPDLTNPGTGALDPAAALQQAGLTPILPTTGPLADIPLTTLTPPLVAWHPTNPNLLRIRPRFTGSTRLETITGLGAVWNKTARWFELPVTEALTPTGTLKPGLAWPPDTLARAHKIPTNQVPAPLQQFARTLATATTNPFGDDPSFTNWLRKLPDWFALDLFDYQQVGSLAAALGRNFLADEPGVGKTRTALAVAATRNATRTLILCPPVMVSTWAANALDSGLATHGGALPQGRVHPILPGRKAAALPACGVVIVADSTVAARQELQDELAAWTPDVFIYDEAHRAMSMGSKRSRAAVRLAHAAGFALPVTGTPLLASPHQLVPLLDMSGHLRSVFGGHHAFLARYCRRDLRGNLIPNRRYLRELGDLLTQEVWVRRTKQDVLPWLPPKFRAEFPVQVPLTLYREAHQDVLKQIDRWIKNYRSNHDGAWPDEAAVAQFASGNLAYVSRLREAAGLTKIRAALEWIDLYDFERTPDGLVGRPLTIWTHHTAVTDALETALGGRYGPVGVIRGGTAASDRDRYVAEFQAGRLAILVGSITAAGVGITLTRGTQCLFVETDWTPALLQQAEDRHHRIGQTEPVVATTMVAEGTLDETIQRALKRKGMLLGAVYGNDEMVAVTGRAETELSGADEILRALVLEQVAAQRSG